MHCIITEALLHHSEFLQGRWLRTDLYLLQASQRATRQENGFLQSNFSTIRLILQTYGSRPAQPTRQLRTGYLNRWLIFRTTRSSTNGALVTQWPITFRVSR